MGANVSNAGTTSLTYYGAAIHIEDVGDDAGGPINGRISLEGMSCSNSIEGVRVDGAVGLTLNDSVISHNQMKGVYGTGMRWSIIANNTISYNGGTGVQAAGIHLFWNDGPLMVSGNEVHDTYSIRENGSGSGVEVKGIFSTSNTDIQITDNIVRDNYLVDTDMALASNSNSRVYGVHSLSDTRPVLMDNEVRGNEALAMMNSSYARTYMYGIHLADGHDALVQANDVRDNVILASKWAYVYAMIVQTSPEVIISGNIITGNSALNPPTSNYSGIYGLYMMNCAWATVTGNEVSHNIKVGNTGMSAGIYMANVDNNTLEGNLIRSNNFTEGDYAGNPSGIGVYLNSGVNDCRFVSNEISYNYAQAIYLAANTNRNDLFLNVFDHNALTTDTYDPNLPQCVDTSSSNVWYHETDLLGNLWTDWTSPDADGNDIVDDPYVIDKPAGDDLYPLTGPVARATSPSIQAVNGSVHLAWSPPAYVLYGDEVRYEVQRSVNGSGFSLLATTDLTTYVDTFPAGAADVAYRIVACTDHGRAPPSEEVGLSETTPPYVRITSPGQGQVIGATRTTVTWEGGDNDSGMDHYQIRVDSAGWINVGLALSYEVTDLAEGAHTVQVMAVDNRTNQATDSVGFEVSVALDLVILAPSPLETFPSGEVQAEWQGWNNDSSISGYEVRVDSGPWVNVGMNTTYAMTGLSEGGHTFSVKAMDSLSNQITASVAFNVSAPPEVAITSPASGQSFESVDVQASWQGWDNGSGLARYEVSVDSGPWVNVGMNTTYLMAGLAEGGHTFSVRATDLLSNQVTATVGFTVNGDPWVEVQCPSPLMNSTSLEVSWTAHDNQSSVVGSEVRLDSGPWVNVGMNTTYAMTGLAEGGHTFSVRVWDAAGNNATAQCHFSVDLTPPTVVSSSPNDDGAPLRPLITIVFSEAMDTATVNVSGVEGSMVWNGTTLSIQVNEDLEPAAVFHLMVNGRDLAGNAMEQYGFNFTTTNGMAVLTGRIQDEQGAPIPGVLVECSNGETATTDSNGDFQFTLAPGAYSFNATKEGYVSLSMEVVLEPGEEEDVVRTMSPENREGGDSGMLMAIAVIAMIALAAAVGYILWRRKG
ncbi:MAG: Y_Y_Y domain protein [Methanomassiliicoccales archaeon PtaB.Bin134]|nr:MAG: Y_Y_Y domain protein [Methanomassiliicoccales archaeon PtaB.Bin134]